MTLASLLLFAAAFTVACASPGPTVVTLVARVLARGTTGAPAFGVGLILGDLAWLAVAVFGLAVIATTFQPVFLAIKYLGCAYLLWLAWKMWTAPATAAALPRETERREGWRLAGAGLALALGNVKAMTFYLALLPALIGLKGLSIAGFLQLSAVIVAIYSVVLTVYIVAAARARRLLANPRALRAVNRVSAVTIGGAAVAIGAR